MYMYYTYSMIYTHSLYTLPIYTPYIYKHTLAYQPHNTICLSPMVHRVEEDPYRDTTDSI